EAGIAEEVLHRELPAEDVAFAIVDRLTDAEQHLRIIRVRPHVIETQNEVDELLSQSIRGRIEPSLELCPCCRHVAVVCVDQGDHGEQVRRRAIDAELRSEERRVGKEGRYRRGRGTTTSK